MKVRVVKEAGKYYAEWKGWFIWHRLCERNWDTYSYISFPTEKAAVQALQQYADDKNPKVIYEGEIN